MKKQMVIKGTLAGALLFLGGTSLKAQFDAMFTQYMFNETFINPAYAGSKEAMSATLLHRQQWVSFPGRPVTTSFSIHGPLMENKMGLGLSILSEKIGAMTRNLVYADYAYRVKVHEGGTMAFGLMGGLDNQIFRYNNLKVSDDPNAQIDPNFSQTPNVMAANFGAGLYYNTKSFFTGLSIPRLLDNDVKFTGSGQGTVKVTTMKASRFTYYFTVGNVFKVADNLKIKGSAMIKAVKNAPMQLDLTGLAFINEMIWAGLSYRSNSSVAVILGLQVNKQFLVNYAYDYGVNRIQRYSNGSHEIALNYLFSFKGRQIITPRYF